MHLIFSALTELSLANTHVYIENERNFALTFLHCSIRFYYNKRTQSKLLFILKSLTLPCTYTVWCSCCFSAPVSQKHSVTFWICVHAVFLCTILQKKSSLYLKNTPSSVPQAQLTLSDILPISSHCYFYANNICFGIHCPLTWQQYNQYSSEKLAVCTVMVCHYKNGLTSCDIQ